MSEKQYLLAIDQGTTSSRAIVFDVGGNIISIAQQEFSQIYPENGWVEHDPEEIWSSTLAVIKQAVENAESKGGKVIAIGITNQRETTLVWDRETGIPVYNAIVWQDRRTADVCKDLKDLGLEANLQSKSGLLLDPYFSATKVTWILDHVDGLRIRADQGQLAFGTIDSFLIWRLTGGRVHATDITNASRTNLYNIHTQAWDPELLKMFNVPDSVLPDVKNCADDFGETEPGILGSPIPILGVAGDQQAASIGQCCFNPGDIKSTYGTGCFVLMNTGESAILSQSRMLTTVAYRINHQTCYALEGSIFIAGAAVQWLRDRLGIIKSAKDTETMAASLPSNQAVY
ncbi:MAG: glycerol kinase GlpK, partial [Gammaproteobacteria bacterium]|nr:glycerol kinase GlpK [Gammaproteobacteria bacterium]